MIVLVAVAANTVDGGGFAAAMAVVLAVAAAAADVGGGIGFADAPAVAAAASVEGQAEVVLVPQAEFVAADYVATHASLACYLSTNSGTAGMKPLLQLIAVAGEAGADMADFEIDTVVVAYVVAAADGDTGALAVMKAVIDVIDLLVETD